MAGRNSLGHLINEHGEMVCDRCKKPTSGLIMSKFNTDWCCVLCKKIEQNHPDYSRACEEERTAVKAGNMNFPGIGKPDNL